MFGSTLYNVCSVRWVVFGTMGGNHEYCGGCFEYCGGVNYRGGILSIVVDTQYRGGYLEYRGGYSVPWGISLYMWKIL